MYNCSVAGVQSSPTALFSHMRRGCSTTNGLGVQPGRYIHILPSERAAAYKMKMEAIKRSAGRPTKNSPQVAANFRSNDEVAKGEDVSGDTIRRYIRLTELQPELQQMVDEKKIALTPAVEISYLKPAEQRLLLDTIESEQATPSLSQAQRMKKLSQSGELNDDTMLEILSEQKKPEKCDITLSGDIFPALLHAAEDARNNNKTAGELAAEAGAEA